jgi:hypothetical protein
MRKTHSLARSIDQDKWDTVSKLMSDVRVFETRQHNICRKHHLRGVLFGDGPDTSRVFMGRQVDEVFWFRLEWV